MGCVDQGLSQAAIEENHVDAAGLTHAATAMFVVSGSGKNDILKRDFEEGSGVPCTLVNENMGDRCSWFVDNAAAEGSASPRTDTC